MWKLQNKLKKYSYISQSVKTWLLYANVGSLINILIYSQECGHLCIITSLESNSKMGSCYSYWLHIRDFPQLWYKFLCNWIFGWGDNYFQVFFQLFSKVSFKILYITKGTISANQSEHIPIHSEQTPAINSQHSNMGWISPGYAGILIKGRKNCLWNTRPRLQNIPL